jgi:DNA-binding CsgD family transcriptional regulator
VAELTRAALGERADFIVIDACRQVTAGNPFYLHELLAALEEEPELDSAELAARVRELAPDAVIRTLRIRVGRLGHDAVALARAVALLGDDAQVRHAAPLAGLSIEQASQASVRLAEADVLLAREPLRFVHPLVRQAIEQDIPASERAGRHLRVARLLEADGAEPELVAAHLLRGRAEGEAWTVGQLRAAARDARARGAVQSAVRYLERALAEPPRRELHAEVLAELGSAEAAAGLEAAAGHLAAAAAGARDPVRKAELALARGQALYERGLHEQSAAAYDEGLSELPAEPLEPAAAELRDALQTGFAVTGLLVPALAARASAQSAALLGRAASGSPRTQGQRLVLAQAAVRSAMAGEPCELVTEFAEQAWDGGRLLDQETSRDGAWSLVTGALTWSGELERSIEVADVVLEDARRRNAPLVFATASYCRAVPFLWQGRVADALADLELARDARRYGWRQFARAAAAVYALCLIETGELEGAEAVLAEDDPVDRPRDLEDALRLATRAELRLAQGRAGEAQHDALVFSRGLAAPAELSGMLPWRSIAAQASLALGDRDQALELARQDRELAERSGVLHARIRSLRVLGLCEQREPGLELLRTAVELGTEAAPRLETMRALTELGAALRRANRRAASREPLQQAAAAARRGGALALHERASTELAATGARPRREALLSGPSSLTPSERRVAQLAALGQSNREIALALFVTPKTVEFHLRNAYRKLEVASRRELARALAA